MFKRLNEAIKVFMGKGDHAYSDKYIENRSGEGVEEFNVPYGVTGISSFNSFYNNYIDKTFETELARIAEYRRMAAMPEIADVIEDVVVEATQENDDGEIIRLDIFDEELEKNENIKKVLYDEFNTLFYNRLNINNKLPELIKAYITDGRVYYERIINKNKKDDGIVGIKRLPAETMDFDYDPKHGRINYFMQFLNTKAKKPKSFEEAEKDRDIITFYPEQIGYVDFGVYGTSRKNVKGYLETVKTPYNQLKLLETSIIIYRVIRAPERLVFRIDTGSMPKDKALKFVEKMKMNMSKKQTYDSVTGRLSNEPAILNLMDNFFIPQCIDLSTEIPLLNGETKSLLDIIEDYNSGIKNEVYSVDQKTGRILPGTIKWAGITRKKAELVRVYLDSGEYVDVTPDHKFVMRDGTEVEAQDLTKNDSVMPFYTRLKRMNSKVVKVEKLPYRKDTGCLTVEDKNNNHNFALACGIFVKNSSDGRGSDITSIGGNFDALKALDDLYYFQKKLYRSLRYPISRVVSRHDRQEEPLFGGRSVSEIGRDEIKWAKFLERKVQTPFSHELLDLFLLHLEFKGLKAQYELNRDKLNIVFNDPSFYKAQQEQAFLETKTNNYMGLAHNPEFSKSYLMKEYLGWTDEEIEENAKGLSKDKTLGLAKDEGRMNDF